MAHNYGHQFTDSCVANAWQFFGVLYFDGSLLCKRLPSDVGPSVSYVYAHQAVCTLSLSEVVFSGPFFCNSCIDKCWILLTSFLIHEWVCISVAGLLMHCGLLWMIIWRSSVTVWFTQRARFVYRLVCSFQWSESYFCIPDFVPHHIHSQSITLLLEQYTA
jgi:hypothetical protein